ncbi:MAG: hypothetical protein CBD18_08985 [Opitutales bacterium TMED158]|nr:MAG: hypothetical protein CBD18_08985 [Opitutales bacterium TMED158]
MGKSEIADPALGSGSGRFVSLVRWIGILATVVCLWFVAKALTGDGTAVARLGASPLGLAAVLGGAFLWMGVNCLLGVAWKMLGRCLGADISWRKSIAISFLSQVAKYLPGNVFHLAGRVWHARQFGISAKVASAVTMGESILLALVASFIGLPLLAPLSGEGPIAIAFVILVLAISVGIWAGRKRIARALGLESARSASVDWGPILVAVTSIVSVFLLQYAMFASLAFAMEVDLGVSIVEGIRMVTATWLAGFVVVGSPGGIGVREAAFALFAASEEGLSDLVLVAALMRISSVLGDLLSFAVGKWLKLGIFVESQ